MTETTAQLALTTILLAGAVVFVYLDATSLAIGLVGAIVGQGATLGVRSANDRNGNGGK